MPAPVSLAGWLFQMKKALGRPGNLVVWERRETRTTMVELGLNEEGLRQVLQGLMVADWERGPAPDNNPGRGGEIVEFGPFVGDGNDRIYVKVKLVAGRPERTVECLSFHRPHWPLRPRNS